VISGLRFQEKELLGKKKGELREEKCSGKKE
jgi:hypothetical protein